MLQLRVFFGLPSSSLADNADRLSLFYKHGVLAAGFLAQEEESLTSFAVSQRKNPALHPFLP